MSKSSKRRLAIAAIKNAADNPVTAPGTPAQLTQAAGTAAALTTQDSPYPSSGLSVLSGLSTSSSDVNPSLNSDLSAIKLPSDPVSNSALLASSSNSQISNFKSPSDSVSAPSLTSPSPPPAAPASPRRGKTLQETLAEPPSEFFKTHLEPHCPPEQVDSILHPAIIRDPNNPAGPIDSQFEDYQAKLKPVFAQLSPGDPNVERIIHNYVIVMQIATVERLIHDLPGMSESAQVETNNQIVRMLSIIERTNSRRARELREKDAAARRLIREQQRKEREAQKVAEGIARTQRNKDREENRRQREKERADSAEQKHQLAIRKLELKERNLNLRERENQLEEKLQHHNSGKPGGSGAAKPGKPVLLAEFQREQ